MIGTVFGTWRWPEACAVAASPRDHSGLVAIVVSEHFDRLDRNSKALEEMKPNPMNKDLILSIGIARWVRRDASPISKSGMVSTAQFPELSYAASLISRCSLRYLFSCDHTHIFPFLFNGNPPAAIGYGGYDTPCN